MPRLTNNDFLMRHRFLKRLWEDEHLQSLYGLLGSKEQWDLHQYYQMINTGSDADIIETRTTVNADDESLTQCAGRAYAKIFSAFQQIARAMDISIDTPKEALPRIADLGVEYRRQMTQRPHKTGPGSRNAGRHYIRAIMKPEIDMERFAKVLIMLAKHLDEEKRKGNPPRNSTNQRKH